MRRSRQSTFAQRVNQAEVTLECGRTIGDEPKYVGNDAELLLDRREQRLRSGRCGFDSGWDRDAGHKDLRCWLVVAWHPAT